MSEPTGITKWKERFPNIFIDWKSNFARIYQITKDNKSRQFLFKILHKVIITKKELKKFNIATDDLCNLCSRTDSIFHTFLECDPSISIYSNIIKWFNDVHKYSNLILLAPYPLNVARIVTNNTIAQIYVLSMV